MATISPEQIAISAPGNYRVWKWSSLTENDTAETVILPAFGDLTFQVEGNFGTSGDVRPHGRAADEGTFFQLNDLQGSGIAFTSAGLSAVAENVYEIKPVVSAGTGVSADIYLLAR